MTQTGKTDYDQTDFFLDRKEELSKAFQEVGQKE